ncbi:MAG: molybdopterin molybdotransferase MoeA [Methylococcales bacterium]|nr:molybdopterin molybdotransferase MoeA [Methylococcales bacterium]
MTIDPCSVDAQRLLSLDEALNTIYAAITPVDGHERVGIKAALERILAIDLLSPISLPRERNSAMDGYAFRSADLKQGEPCSLFEVGISWAGKPFNTLVKQGECVRIFTGAVLPEGTDSVIMQEQVQVNGSSIHLPATASAKRHVREAGEDVCSGEKLLTAGKKLNAADIGLLAAVGLSDVPVIRPLRVAFFSTGDELVAIGQPLSSGQLYDSNRYTLQALLQNARIASTDLGVVRDNPDLLENLLTRNAPHYDVIISTGGASVGDADYIKQVLDRCGEVNFWKIAIKPGKPLAFGQIGDCYFFGLPGNPAAVITTFQQVVTPALQHLCGMQPTRAWRIKATCLHAIKKAPGRLEFQRGIVSQNAAGDFEVHTTGEQGSHRLSSCSHANCVIVLNAECQGVCAGEIVTVEPF